MQFIFYNSDSISNTVYSTVKTEGGGAKSKDVSNVLSKVHGLDPDLTELCGVRRTMSAGFLSQPGNSLLLLPRRPRSSKLQAALFNRSRLPAPQSPYSREDGAFRRRQDC